MTTILRGGRGQYKQKTLIGNWEEDRVLIDYGAANLEQPGYETTKGLAEQKAGECEDSYQKRKKNTSIMSYQEDEGPMISIQQMSQDRNSDLFQKQFGSKCPLKPASVLTRDQLDNYRKQWSIDHESRDFRFVTENVICNNEAAPRKFHTRSIRNLPNVPVVVQNLQETMIRKSGPHALRKLRKTFSIYDQNEDQVLSKMELKELLFDFNASPSPDDFEVLFRHFDRNDSNTIEFAEFLHGLIGPISEFRRKLVAIAFAKLQHQYGEELKLEDILESFMLTGRPGSIKNRISKEFKSQWWMWGNDSQVSNSDFQEYYNCLSPAVLNDADFQEIINASWRS